MKVVGLLLAGGASRRFGREKAVAPFRGGALMDRPLQALMGACGEVAVSAREGSGAATIAGRAALAVLPDSPSASSGPLLGILAGIEWAVARNADLLVSAPCDAASLRADQLDLLVRTARMTGCVAVGKSPRGLEPMLAAWPVAPTVNVLRRELDGGAHPAVKDVIAMLGFTSVEGFDGVNVNAPSDLASLGERLDGGDSA